MTLIIPEGYAQVVLTYSSGNFDSGNAATVLGYGRDLDDDVESLGTFSALIAQAWEDNLRSSTDNNVTLEQVEAIGPTSSGFTGVGLAGTRTAQSQPPNIAVLSRKVVTRRGRRAQGRVFWPSLLDLDDVDEAGFLSPTKRTSLSGAIQGFFDDTTSSVEPLEVEMVILQNTQRIVGGVPQGSPPLNPPPGVVALTVEAKVASQRHRLRA